MKKRITAILLIVFGLLMTTGCTQKHKVDVKALESYKAKMTDFFADLETIDFDIKAIDPENSSSIESLFSAYDKMEKEMKKLTEMNVPVDMLYHDDIITLSNEAYDYMVQANQYMHDSFGSTSFNEYTLEAATECYKRVNKRIQYIIYLLRDEVPGDDVGNF